MTTKPSDMKPTMLQWVAERAEKLAASDTEFHPELSFSDVAICQWFDERHAAGQGEPKSKGPRYCDEHGGYGFRSDCLHCAPMDRAPVAAGPELSPCPGCGELFQPNDGIGGNTCSRCRYRPRPVAAPPAQPVAAEPNHPFERFVLDVTRHELHELPKRLHGYLHTAYAQGNDVITTRDGYNEQRKEKPAVPVAGEPTQGVPAERYGSSYWMSVEQKMRLARDEARRERDAALAQVEQLKGELLGDAAHQELLVVCEERDKARRARDYHKGQVEELKSALSLRDQLESSLRDDVTEAQANAEARHSEFQGQCTETVRLKEQMEQLTKRVAELEPAAGEPIWSRHNLLHELRERKVETTGLRKALTAANERAARLEAERPHLLEAARLLPLARRDWRGVVDSDVRRFAIDMAAWERASEPPPVATGEALATTRRGARAARR